MGKKADGLIKPQKNLREQKQPRRQSQRRQRSQQSQPQQFLRHRRYTLFDYFNILFFIILMFVMILPFWTVLMTSLVTSAEYYSTPFILWPKEPTLLSYRFVFATQKVTGAMLVTITITIAGTLYSMLMTTTLAYGLAKKDLIGRNFLLTMLIITMYFDGGLIPYYFLVRGLGLYNNFWVYIIPSAISIWNFIIIKAFFNQLPAELEESARIDGANDIVIFIRIILPLSLPTLATFALFYGVGYWNTWWPALLFISNERLYPLQMVLRKLIVQMERPVEMSQAYLRSTSGKWQTLFEDGIRMATVVVATAPILIMYPFLQKYFVKGITLGSVKG